MTEFDTLCERYLGLLKRAAEESYPIGVKAVTTREQAVSDWEAAAFLPTDDLDMAVTLSHIETARETINKALDAPIQPVGSRKGKDTWGYRPDRDESPAADGDSTPAQSRLFADHAEPRERAAPEEAGP